MAGGFVVVIPARLKSTRLPDKPLADIAGKPMVVRVAERALQCGASRVVVATDHASIVDACAAHGVEALLTRADHPSGTDRLAEVADLLALPDDQVVVNVQGDEPLIEPGCLEALLGAFGDPAVEMATLRRPLCEGEEGDPNVVKVVCARSGDALYFSRSPIPYLRRRSTELFVHVGVYAYRKPFLQQMTTFESTPLEKAESLEQLRVLEYGHRIRTVLTEHRSLGVDTPEDLERAARRLELQG